MATFSYTWVQTQTAFNSAVDQGDQYEQLGLAYVNTFVTGASWTVERSSDGTTAGAGNNITTQADIVWGDAGLDAHSWIVLRPPTGKGNPSGGGQMGIIIDWSESDTDTTPQSIEIFVGHGPLATNGSTTTRATLTTEDQTMALNVIPWAAATAGSYVTWTNSNNDVLLGVKQNGNNFFEAFNIYASDPDNATGNNTLWVFGQSSTVDVVTATNMTSSALYRNMLGDASPAATAVGMIGVSFELTNWTNGQNSDSSTVPWRDIELASNSGTAGNARHLGLFRDVLCAPNNTPFNTLDQNDDGASSPYEWRSIGALVVPSNAVIT